MDERDNGALPQGLIEQARARNVDPGKLQYLGKKAAALHSSSGKSLTDSVVDTLSQEDLGPEHTRRICEFANQEAFKNEWEKGGSVRNVEFQDGPADPSQVLKELNDGSHTPTRKTSDYDSGPVKTASAAVEDEIFAGFTEKVATAEETPRGLPDLQHNRTTMIGAQDHIFSKVAGLDVAKEQMVDEFSQAVGDEILKGTPMQKIAQAVSSVAVDPLSYREAFDAAHEKLAARGIRFEEPKTVDGRSVPNPSHPVVQSFMGFQKVAREIRVLRESVNVLDEQLGQVDRAIKTI